MRHPFFLAALLLLVFASVPDVIVAQNLDIRNLPGAEGITEALHDFADFLFRVALVVLPIVVLVAGFFFITGGGEPERLRKARSILLWAVIGFVVVLFARVASQIIADLLGINIEG